MSGRLLEGKIVVVTGAASGIGRAAAIAFAAEGAKVMASDVKKEACEETVATIRGAGGEAQSIACNVAKEDEVAALVAKTIESYGRLDCAFNNAGVSNSGFTMDMEVFRRTIDINLMGVAHCLKYELAQMLKQGGGVIVNTASIAGLTGSGTLDYCASKHGIVGMTRAAALHFASKGIRVNAVCPGVIETPMTAPLAADPAIKARLEAMTPMGRMGKAEEIADAVIWLCSSKASYVSGQAIAVDGAFMCK
ncbi:MAG TPA: glucose 1-dehydrogenase [Steroidobacteraceae bacterium]|nr:glucose 1-dehydrogenase [Steroidobacteraceae bacterium]